MRRWGFDLHSATETADSLKKIEKRQLAVGDYLLVSTRNSVYQIQKVDEHIYEVSGGWFDLQNLSPARLNIRGCTWGGSAIKVDVAAACGLCLEFDNNVTTSTIRKFVYIPLCTSN